MTTNTRHSYKLSIKRATRRRRRRRQPPQQRKISSSIATFKPMQKCNNGLSQKLQALKSLIPTHHGDTVIPDQLFKETADYIVFLRTRVALLHKLIEYYGNHNHNHNVLLL
uniref:Uncharacterized protein n=1 Tax=Cajanus cajan TaxID=3821 RepID=A0A151T011_CAJCA|nr:hypothetical protein KK1_022789 [Cajanus cajan]